MLMKLIITFQSSGHIDELHCFNHEPLDTLDKEELVKRITKSFDLNIGKTEAR